jgi:hypothetical protein
MPSRAGSAQAHLVVGREQVTNSRMLDSEGCAIINGGGFCEIVWYSLVSCFLLDLV